MSSNGQKHAPNKAVGIDLGTTYSVIAHIDAYGKPQIIPNADGERITPSVILFDGINAIVGTVAKQNAVAEPEKIVDFIKREIGKSKAEFHREFNGRMYSAEELSAVIIKKLKLDAERFLGEPVNDAVITVPAYFNDAERTATMNSGRLAGLNVLQVINEPTAAALAYGLDKLGSDQTVFVFDLGGVPSTSPSCGLPDTTFACSPATATIGWAEKTSTTSSSTGSPRSSTGSTVRIRCWTSRATRTCITAP